MRTSQQSKPSDRHSIVCGLELSDPSTYQAPKNSQIYLDPISSQETQYVNSSEASFLLPNTNPYGFSAPSIWVSPTQIPPIDSTREAVVPRQIRYACLFPNCESDFARVTDLARHNNSVHPRPGSRIDCPYKWCGRVGESGFSRKDHLKEHMRGVHREDIPKRNNRREKEEYSV